MSIEAVVLYRDAVKRRDCAIIATTVAASAATAGALDRKANEHKRFPERAGCDLDSVEEQHASQNFASFRLINSMLGNRMDACGRRQHRHRRRRQRRGRTGAQITYARLKVTKRPSMTEARELSILTDETWPRSLSAHSILSTSCRSIASWLRPRSLQIRNVKKQEIGK